MVNSGLPSDDRTIVVALAAADDVATIDDSTSTVSITIMAHDFVAGLISFNVTNVTLSEGEGNKNHVFLRKIIYDDDALASSVKSHSDA